MKVLCSVICFLLCTVSALARDVRFAYEYVLPLPTGFELRVSSTPGGSPSGDRVIDCGQALECVAPGIYEGTWYVRAYAYNDNIPVELGREYSDSSNEVMLKITSKPLSPSNTHIVGAGYASLEFEVPEDSIATIELSFKDKPEELDLED